MGWYLRIGGILLAAISLFRLVHTWLQFGLKPIFVKMVEWYGALFEPLGVAFNSGLKFIFSWIKVTPPHIPSEVLILWLLLGSALYRKNTADKEKEIEYKRRHKTSAELNESNVIADSILGITADIVLWPGELSRIRDLSLNRKRLAKIRAEYSEYEIDWELSDDDRLVRKHEREIEHLNFSIKYHSEFLWGWFFQIAIVILAFVLLFAFNAYGP
jgi:hypothetical protein